MTLSKAEVLAALALVKAPDGKALPQTGALSDVVVSDGKVFFSINVEASAVPRWESVRKAAEAAVRALPGVNSAMVALTAERASSSGAPAPGPAQRPSHPGAMPAAGGPKATGVPGVAAIIAVASGK